MVEQAGMSAEKLLQDGLTRGDAVIASARPVLRYLLSNEDSDLFTDEVIARIRGMVFDMADRLLFAVAEAAGISDRDDFLAKHLDDLVTSLSGDEPLLGHAHALALEGRMAEALQERSDVDAVLPPLVQELAASDDETVAGLAMSYLAAQARFMQHQRRMELPLGELPGDLFHKALLILQSHDLAEPEVMDAAIASLRKGFDEAHGRLGLVTRLVTCMGGKLRRALRVEQAGLAIFATALAMGSDQDRDLAILALNGRLPARLALSLRAAGLKAERIRAQFAYLQPMAMLPDGLDGLSGKRAAAILAEAELGTAA